VTLQVGGALPRTVTELLAASSLATKVILGVLLLFSLICWFLILLKALQFRRVRKRGDRFFGALQRTTRLQDAYHVVMKLPPSPYGRLLREGVNFFSELRPGALQEERELQNVLTPTQLEALRMVLAKELAAERDLMAQYLPWLATIGSVSPLLGLLGTVLGVMDAFLGIAAGGSGNVSAVAPGIAEALITTVLGLAVAIPAIIAYNLFVNRLGVFAGELEGFAYEIVGTMAREGRI
jgi:biopolymer transport protein TolQ